MRLVRNRDFWKSRSRGSLTSSYMFSQVCKARGGGGGGGGGGTAVYGLYRHVPAVKGMVFKQFALGYSI